ncbi:MAG: RimK/LysX family protein [Candidatus Marinimicrobia bacterium]|nr:RimK/LysX family protein [Candidatus Neomarinimicrobiota bacterium]MCF7828446.1 RimK/LysX family protein [Candidatus Neomarinimicrobiota bacterium]MCF7880960.1 RimK/LysX family protein [Candidatus Neomarinimicrobiota bacterium]
MPDKPKKEPTSLGWREWIALPELGIDYIKAKIDTGARTSALHVHNLKVLEEVDDGYRLRVAIHPVQRSSENEVTVEVLAHDKRNVRSSVGHEEHRYVIETPVKIGDREFPVEITLTNRDAMGFRMLLGRSALRKGFVINPKKSFVLGKPEAIQRKEQ